MADAGPLFESALQELGIAVPSPDDAAWILLRYHVGRVADCEVAPRQGLRAILEDVYYPAELHAQRERYGADMYDVGSFHSSFHFHDDLEACPGEVSFEGLYGEYAMKALVSCL